MSIKNWNCDILKHARYYFDASGLTETRVVYVPVNYVVETGEIVLFANIINLCGVIPLKLFVFLNH